MKKQTSAVIYTIAATLICTFALYGCGTTDNAASSASTPGSVPQKSAETRQQIQTANRAPPGQLRR